jgi:hypothetical protein
MEQRVRSAVGAHSAPLIELVSNAKVAINVKYNNITALHTTSKLALSEALTLLNASNLNQWALTTVDNVMTAAVALGDLIDQRISKEVTLAVIATVDKIVAREIQPRVQGTLAKFLYLIGTALLWNNMRQKRNLRRLSRRNGHWPRWISRIS